MTTPKRKKPQPGNGYTWDELADKIGVEGFDYFFRFYTSPEKFTDEKLRILAAKYVAAAKELQDYLEEMGGI